MKFTFNTLFASIFAMSIVFSSCEVLSPLLQGKSKSKTTASTSATDDLPEPKKVYKGFKIPSGPMDTEEVLIAQAKAAAISQAKRRADLLKKKKKQMINEAGNGQMLTIEEIEAQQAKEAAKKVLERRKRIKANRLKVEKQKEEQMLAKLDAQRQKEELEKQRLQEAYDRQKALEAKKQKEAAIAAANKAKADKLAKENEAKQLLAAQEKKQIEEANRIAQERKAKEEAAKQLLAAKQKADKEAADRITKQQKEAAAKQLLAEKQKALQDKAAAKKAALLAVKQLEKDNETLANVDVKTKATKKKVVETGKEKAMRMAREKLGMEKEGKDYQPTARKAKKEIVPPTNTVSTDEEKIEIVNTARGLSKEKISHTNSLPIKTNINQPKIDFAEAPMTAVAPPKISPKGAKLPSDLVATKRVVKKKPILEEVTKMDLPSNTLKDYYFPVENLENAKAYRYIAEGDFPDTTYWLMKALTFNGKNFLITETYDSKFQLKQSVKEMVNKNGVFLMDYTSYEIDGLGEVNNVIAGVDDDESFKWKMEKGDKIAMSLNYNSSLYPNYDITTYRERTFVNESESVIFDGQALRTVMFEDKETAIFTDNRDEQETYASTYFNQYAEGIGLVKYVVNKNSKDNSEFKTYKLNKIMSYDEWQKIHKPHQKR